MSETISGELLVGLKVIWPSANTGKQYQNQTLKMFLLGPEPQGGSAIEEGK